jgi:hypothetical protein
LRNLRVVPEPYRQGAKGVSQTALSMGCRRCAAAGPQSPVAAIVFSSGIALAWNAVAHRAAGYCAGDVEGGFVWRRLPAAQLPPGRDGKFRERYERSAAGDRVTRTLQMLTGCFTEGAADLNPP